MDYTLRELECFAAVAEELSFTRAARRLRLAQPPLSRHIRSLEEKIGSRLFAREPRRVSLTPEGRLFYEESRDILPQLVRAGELVRRSARGETARLRLGFVSAVHGAGLVPILRRFRESHPSVQLLLHDLPPSEQLGRIAEGRLDGGFVGLLPSRSPGSLRFLPWSRERLLAFLPSGHPLARRRRIRLGDLKAEGFVAVSAEAAPAFSAFLHALCRSAGFRPRILLDSPRAQAVAVMVAAGSGVALLPESVAQVTGDSAAAIPLQGSPEITHVFAHPATPPPPAMRHLLDLLTASGNRAVRPR